MMTINLNNLSVKQLRLFVGEYCDNDSKWNNSVTLYLEVTCTRSACFNGIESEDGIGISVSEGIIM
jgi:hypothetical protein